jgi:DNA-binding CsgD family transcriptional regulator
MMLSDSRNKARALGRIKRLASSGLPLEPFVRSVFELINDAVPNNPNRGLHVGSDRSDAYICTPETRKIVPLHNHYFVKSPSEISGARFRLDLETLKHVLPSKTIWLQHEAFGPNVYRAEGFNETYRPLGWHHTVGVIFQEAGKYEGYYGIWRSLDQKPFNRDDIAFLTAAAPHITHGLKTAQLIERDQSDPTGFAPIPSWGSGVILLGRGGKPKAMDAAARLIFQQIGVFDGVSADAFASRPVRDALNYVSHRLQSIFDDPDDGESSTAPAPVYRLYQHWTGIVLKLRGVKMMATDGREYTAILVERGETVGARHLRMSARWGLSQREAEILSLICEGKTGPEIAVLLAISHDTVRKHTSRILDKLGVETRTAAVTIATRDADDA